MTHSHIHSSWLRVTLVHARGDRVRPERVQSFEDRCSIRCCVVEAGGERSAVSECGGPGSLLDRGCLSSLRVEAAQRNAGGALAEPHSDEHRCRRRWSKLCPNFNKNCSLSELKLLRNLDLQKQYRQSTKLPKLKFGKILRVSLM